MSIKGTSADPENSRGLCAFTIVKCCGAIIISSKVSVIPCGGHEARHVAPELYGNDTIWCNVAPLFAPCP